MTSLAFADAEENGVDSASYDPTSSADVLAVPGQLERRMKRRFVSPLLIELRRRSRQQAARVHDVGLHLSDLDHDEVHKADVLVNHLREDLKRTDDEMDSKLKQIRHKIFAEY